MAACPEGIHSQVLDVLDLCLVDHLFHEMPNREQSDLLPFAKDGEENIMACT
jgi:hypothetical protein